jgi:hypothetical protein
MSVAILKTPQTALRGESRSDASLTLSRTSNSLPAFWMTSIFVKLSFAGSVAIVDVEALTTGAVVGSWVFVLVFPLSLLNSFMVTDVGCYDLRMASREIGEALNDGIGTQVSKTIYSSHEIAKEQYHCEALEFKE